MEVSLEVVTTMNRVQLIGNLGVDPTLRKTKTGKPVCNFTVATNRYFTDTQGREQHRVEWHRIVVWGRSAEVCSEFLRKGRRVYLEGSLRTRQWQDRDGTKRYTTEVITNFVDFLGATKPEDKPKHHREPEEVGSYQPDVDDEDLEPPF